MANLTTKLQAVNSVLRAAGQHPVNSISSSRADVRIVEDYIDEVSLSLQMDGWNFNTEYGVTFSQNGDGEIPVPDNLLRFVLDRDQRYEHTITIRNGKLYNTTKRTATISKDLKGDAVYVLEFQDLPQSARQYIMAKATRLYLAYQIGDRSLVEHALREESVARQKLLNHEADTARYTIFENNPARPTNKYRFFRD